MIDVINVASTPVTVTVTVAAYSAKFGDERHGCYAIASINRFDTKYAPPRIGGVLRNIRSPPLRTLALP